MRAGGRSLPAGAAKAASAHNAAAAAEARRRLLCRRPAPQRQQGSRPLRLTVTAGWIEETNLSRKAGEPRCALPPCSAGCRRRRRQPAAASAARRVCPPPHAPADELVALATGMLLYTPVLQSKPSKAFLNVLGMLEVLAALSCRLCAQCACPVFPCAAAPAYRRSPLS